MKATGSSLGQDKVWLPEMTLAVTAFTVIIIVLVAAVQTPAGSLVVSVSVTVPLVMLGV